MHQSQPAAVGLSVIVIFATGANLLKFGNPGKQTRLDLPT
jgi:hypothetical protein